MLWISWSCFSVLIGRSSIIKESGEETDLTYETEGDRICIVEQ